MQIEIDKAIKLSLTGSSLLRSLQNNSTPVLDLLVRESVQNSLDAAKKGASYVNVDFSIVKFKSKLLNRFFDGIQPALDERFPNHNYNSLVITDKNTVGLDGPVNQEGLTSTLEYGNFWNLVYDIQKAQSAEGAGGSWGLGKTIYFRVGIGLVIYYSRIELANGKYESRLAATLVEDENKINRLIPKTSKEIQTGIAWWGELTDKNETIPVTDISYINELLTVFGIDPFNGDETGTKIIIPYIDEEELLNSHVNIEDKNNGPHTPWAESIIEYLKIAIFRWYTPRLNNVAYGTPYLKASVNNNPLTYIEMPEIFKLIKSLYNKALGVKENEMVNFFVQNDIDDEEILISDFKSARLCEAPATVGKMAAIKINKNYLMKERCPDPYTYLNINYKKNEDYNSPIILYTRKPGMIVNFFPYSKNILPTINDDEYIVSIFVTDRKTNFKNNYSLDNNGIEKKQFSIEEYFRKSELADHCSWNDYPIFKDNKTYTPNIITNLFKDIQTQIQANFTIKVDEEKKSFNSMLGEMFGKILLPPNSFGKGPSLPTKKHKESSGSERVYETKTSLKIEEENIMYRGNNVLIPATVNFVKDYNLLNVELRVDGDGDGISYKIWEDKLKLNMPFFIKEIEIIYPQSKIVLNPVEKSTWENDNIAYSFVKSSNDVCIGFSVNNQINIKKKLSLIINIEFKNKEYKPSIFTNNSDEV